MPTNYSQPVKHQRLQMVNDAVSGRTFTDSTGTVTAGSLVIGNSSLSGATGVLATIPLVLTGTANGAFNTPASNSMTLAGTPLSATAIAAGTAAIAEFRNNSGIVVCGGLTVGTLAADIIVNTTTITGGQLVVVTSGTITHG
jgi:hypothetical protein